MKVTILQVHKKNKIFEKSGLNFLNEHSRRRKKYKKSTAENIKKNVRNIFIES